MDDFDEACPHSDNISEGVRAKGNVVQPPCISSWSALVVLHRLKHLPQLCLVRNCSGTTVHSLGGVLRGREGRRGGEEKLNLDIGGL